MAGTKELEDSLWYLRRPPLLWRLCQRALKQ